MKFIRSIRKLNKTVSFMNLITETNAVLIEVMNEFGVANIVVNKEELKKIIGEL